MLVGEWHHIMKPHEEHLYGTVPMMGHTKLPFLTGFVGSAVLMIAIAIAIASVDRGSAVRNCQTAIDFGLSCCFIVHTAIDFRWVGR